MRGREQGGKDRPCAIVVALQAIEGRDARVLLAPITHSQPSNPGAAIEIPARVKQHIGLDDARSWIIAGELNSVSWADPGIVPASGSSWAYGCLPPKLVAQLIDLVREGQSGHRLKVVSRIDPNLPSPEPKK